MSWTDPPDRDGEAPWPFLSQRRFLVSHSAGTAGLSSVRADRLSSRSWRLTLTFFPRGRRLALTRDDFRITGPEGEELTGLRVASVDFEGEAAVAELSVEDPELRRRLPVDRTPYTLSLVGVEHLDPFFSRTPLFFAGTGPPEHPAEAAEGDVLPATPQDVDYLSKDYESFRTMMLDHMARSLPNWRERNPADLGVTIVEVLAYAGDYLSYYQDAVATEAYLQTARRRVSVRRHATLLDYKLGEGSNTRMWIWVSFRGDSLEDVELADEPLYLPQGSQFLSDLGNSPPVIPYPSEAYDQALENGTEVFETLYGKTLWPSLEKVEIYHWGAADFTLEAGATKATLVGRVDHLENRDDVLFEQVASPRTGAKEDVDLLKRQVVRLSAPPRTVTDPLAPGIHLTEIEWHPLDALDFDLPVRRHAVGEVTLAVLRGNLVLADHGRTTSEQLSPVPLERPYRPRLDLVGPHYRLVHHEPYDLHRARRQPAGAAAEQDPGKVVPALALFQLEESGWIEQGTVVNPLDGRQWSPRNDLLRSGRFARHFVAETENDGTVRIRFGDDKQGERPEAGSRFWAFYRVAAEVRAAIGPGTRAQLVAAGTAVAPGQKPAMPPAVETRVLGAAFPTGAMEGRPPETTEHARLFAPQSASRQERCVTAEDFAHRALEVRGVLDSWCRLEWGGSWTVARLRVQRQGGRSADAAFLERVHRSLRKRVIMGYQLEIEPPHFVPLDIALTLTLSANEQRGLTRRRTREAFGTGMLPDGDRAFFHPDAFGFGQNVPLDRLIDTALEVPGVLDVEVTRFRRLDVATGEEMRRGQIPIEADEIAELNDRRGRLTLHLQGGR